MKAQKVAGLHVNRINTPLRYISMRIGECDSFSPIGMKLGKIQREKPDVCSELNSAIKNYTASVIKVHGVMFV